MNTVLAEKKIMYRLISAFFIVLFSAIWIISSLSKVSYNVEHNMEMLVQDHLPKLDTIYTLQSSVKSLELVLYNYYETTDSDYFEQKWSNNQSDIKGLLVNFDTGFINEVNGYLAKLSMIANQFDLEMKHPNTDWDMLRQHLARSTGVSDALNKVLSEHAVLLRVSFKQYSNNTETVIENMVLSQVIFSGFVLVLLVILAFALKRMLKQQQINRELARYPEQNPYPILRLDKHGEVMYLNPAANKLAQLHNCVEKPLELLPDSKQQQVHTIDSENASYKSSNYSIGNRMFSAIFHQTDTDDSLYAYLLDVTDRVKAEDELIHRSNHDLLTNLPNRRRLNQDLERYCSESLNPFSLLFIKVNRLELINASLGHEMSDKVLKTMSHRLSSYIAEQNDRSLYLYSFEATSWVVIYQNSSNLFDTKALGDTLTRLFLTPLLIDDLSLSMQCNIGITSYPQGGCSPEELIRNADAALRQSVKEGAAVRLYSDDLTDHATRTLELEQGLKQALDKQELMLFIQAKVDAQTQQFVGGEVLIRWKYNDVFISPAEFIPIAEESDLIIAIGEWVLLSACQQWVKWKSEGLDPKRIAVNISAQHFVQPNFVDYVSHILTATGIPPSALELEITEEVATAKPEKLIKTMQQLKALGVSLAIDDFGTGYSSLSYLMQFPIDTLKIDKAFIANMFNSSNDAALVRMIMSLAKELQLEVVAEGVETEQEFNALAELGCEYIQGYYFYRPMPLDAYQELLN